VHVFIHALWAGARHTAMTVLRDTDSFWERVCLSLFTHDIALPSDKERSDEMEAIAMGAHNAGHVMNILALELYDCGSIGGSLDLGLQAQLNSM